MSYYARSVFHTTNIAIWQLGVVLGSQHLLFVTWGHRVHQERGLIVAMDVCDLLGPLSFTKILEDNVCREIFMLCSFRQQAFTLSRFSVDVEGDYVIFSVIHFLRQFGPHHAIEFLSMSYVSHISRMSSCLMFMKFIYSDIMQQCLCIPMYDDKLIMLEALLVPGIERNWKII
jgi:hypothetical protein